MSVKPITIEEVMETLTPDEQEVVRREDFSVPLGFYLEGININPQTTEESRENAVLKVRQAAIKRVSIRNEIKKNPDILNTPADNPVLIAGFHRCGTTLLHRLLENDKQFLCPKFWEMMEPLPPGRVENYRETERYQQAKRDFEKTIYNLEESSIAKHDYSFELADECMSILQDYFLELPELIFIKTMNKWADFVYNCPKQHVTNAYKYYRQFLQCLFYKSITASQRILVKSAMHTLFMDTYAETFPDVRYVLIYRNPSEMVPSLSSLADDIGRRLGYNDDKLGKRMAHYYSLATSRAVKYFQNLPEDKYIIIGYSELVKDPMAVVKKIYSKFNLALTPEADDAMQRYLAENKQNKHGKHKYSLEHFGLTEEDIKENLKDYIEYFKDGTEKMPI